MESKEVVKRQENISDSVLKRVNEMSQSGGLTIPHNYSPENALKSAYLILQETKDRNGKDVLTACSQTSIANALLDMVVQGLNPVKKQCYFIAYGDKLQLSRSYEGSVAVSKRVGLKMISANVIYEGDVFEYAIDPMTGRRKVTKHEQSLENIDISKIKGAYATTIMQDDTSDVEVMTIKQIQKAWLQGAAKGNSGAHQNFTDEMCKKTVINRACKSIISQSDDSYLYDDEAKEREVVQQKNETQQQDEQIEFTQAEVISTEQPPVQNKPETKPEQPKKEKGKQTEIPMETQPINERPF